MKDTINRLARGVFQYEPPVIEISEVNIEEMISVNSIYCGELRIKSSSGQPIKGVVYSSNHAVVMEKPTFVGVDTIVMYKVDTRGVEKGEKIDGCFNIVSNGGESNVTYEFKIVDNAVKTSVGTLKNLFHFTNLVQSEPDEAYKVFVSDSFEKIFIKNDYELRNRYELLLYGEKPNFISTRTDIKQCVEEFLVSIRKKTRINIAVSAKSKDYYELENSMTDSVLVSKSTWGAVKIQVESDNPCIKPAVDFIDEERFAASKYELTYFIDYTKLHRGKNFARLRLSTQFQTIDIEMCLTRACDIVDKDQKTIKIHKYMAFIVESYLSFRTKKINLSQWTKQSLDAIEKSRSLDDEDYFLKLVHAQLLVAVRKKDEAKWLLENVKEFCMDKQEECATLYSYYLYVNSLLRQDAAYANDSLKIVRKLYEDGHDDWRILWIIFYLDDEYEKNKSLKAARIKEQFYKGCTSTLMYLEAALAFDHQPLLIRVFDEFEIQTLLFACKRNMISDRLMSHLIGLGESKKNYSVTYLKLMISLYEKSKSKDLLSVIYKMVVRKEDFGKDDFKWIKAAVEADLRITNLYENYLIFCDKKSMAMLPKMLLLYFTYNSGLDYKLKAYLFANIYYNRYDDPTTFENYRYQIERFVIEQVSKGRIDSNLARLYGKELEPSMINADTSQMLSNILFSYCVKCSNKDITTVYVKHKETGQIQAKTFVDGEAYVNIYTSGVGIVLGDKAGNRFVDETMYTVEKVFEGDKFIPLAYKYQPGDLWMSLYFSENGSKYGYSDYDMVSCYKKIIANGNVSEFYRNECIEKVIDYYYLDYDGDDFDSEYIEIDVDKLSEESRIKVIETYIINGRYESAMEIIRKRGALQVNPKKLLRMCGTLINNVDGERDEETLGICEMVFKQKKYDEEVLNYLVKYYDCSTRDMVTLWKAARNFDIDTQALEERILYQMMFVGAYNSNMPKIFENYFNNGPKQRVVEAYISYNSYRFFVKEQVIETDIFRVIEHRVVEDIETVDVCKLALLKFYADDIDTIKLKTSQITIARKLITEMTKKGVVFDFYKKFAECMELPYGILDKSMVEYKCNPESKVLIHYVLDGEAGRSEYIVENMHNVFEGIHVKSFVLFFGECMQYYITEDKGQGEELTASGSLRNEKLSANETTGRYEMINDMLACLELNDGQTMKKMMNAYVMSEMMTEKIFKPV